MFENFTKSMREEFESYLKKRYNDFLRAGFTKDQLRLKYETNHLGLTGNNYSITFNVVLEPKDADMKTCENCKYCGAMWNGEAFGRCKVCYKHDCWDIVEVEHE